MRTCEKHGNSVVVYEGYSCPCCEILEVVEASYTRAKEELEEELKQAKEELEEELKQEKE